MKTRFDLVFSYWIFIWYIFYMFNIVKYNPKWALTIGLIENLFALSLMILYKNSLINIFLFCVINLFIKIIQLWSLRNTAYKINGIYSLIIVFCLYLIWLKINHVPFKNIFEWIKNNEDPGPFTYYIKQLFKNNNIYF